MMKAFRHTAATLLLGVSVFASTGVLADTAGTPTRATIHADTPGPVYDKDIFTQFAEHLGEGIYGGLWVGEDSAIPNTNGFRNDVVGALRDLSVPVIRWPGGCFADEYHWREGVGPRKDRPTKVNTHWGGVTEPNTVGTHEFFELTRQVGAEAYVAGNVGNGSPREMAEWIEYMTAPAGTLAEERAENGHKEPWKVKYFGVGNELWGCGGNMRPEYAADVTRRYSTFIKPPADTKILKVAAGANVEDYNWTEQMMKIAGNMLDGLSLHYYVHPAGGWPPRAPAVDFDESGWADALHEAWRMDELITKHSAIMDKYDPEKRLFLAVDEWGSWYAQDEGTHPGFLRQQNTMRDALIAAINLDIFAKHADRVRMTAIAQMVNVLQAMIFTKDDQMVLTPTYHVFEMYKPWQDATVLPIDIQTPTYKVGDYTLPAVSGSAVKGKDGKIHVGLSNADAKEANTVTIALDGVKAGKVSGRILTAGAINAHNTFENPEVVKPAAFNGARVKGGTLTVTLPAKSVVVLELQ
ncbi:alpha-N-arabinofuranosidase [Novosphingobium decolorationis]|uniref:non-reducing end alpha-L-arabinofuranosidase n=1 Tax=Novosphingobium decolorationis TaxID=2698673 RepID=A0ABX8E2W1_9SPHN|nr:alpha-L-arabinofuranosidase C-terminal domain-containing protein [Novosphingobium decolorationis]QVM83472.1 alpha-N-arabinofuranosidase [Novosphingobium decolorationis]